MQDVSELSSREQEKLKKYVRGKITQMFSSVLDFVEVAVDGKDRFMSLRSKILKVSNDAIREIHKEIDSRYTVKYVAPAEEVIVFKNNK